MAKTRTLPGHAAPAKKDADGAKPSIILQEIVVRPVSRGNVDIQKWRDAITAAEATNPRRLKLYDLYKEVLLDGHVVSVTNKRLMGATNADWVYFDSTGKEVPEMMDFIDTPAFEELVSEIVNSKIWGYTMCELSFRKGGQPGIYTIPRKHIRPESGMVMYEQNGMAGFSVRDGRYRHTVLEAGKPDDLGLLMVVAQYAIYKRGNIGDWAGYNEIFGTPIIDAVWDGFNEDQRVKLLQAIQNVGNGGAIVRPQGTEISTLAGSSSGQNTGQLWDNFTMMLNKEISKAILGQTETTESTQGSGYAQAKQHGETEDDVNKSDIKYVRHLLNRRLIPMMEAHGANTAGGYFAIRNEGQEKLSLKDRIAIDEKLKVNMNLPMGDDYLYDVYKIEKPVNYEQLTAEKQAAVDAAAAKPAPPDPSTEKPEKVQMADRGWLRRLREVFQIAPESGADISTLVQHSYELAHTCCGEPELPVKLSFVDDAFIRRMYNEATASGGFDRSIFEQVAKELTGAVSSGLAITGPQAGDPVVSTYESMRENVYRFSHAKTAAQLQSFNAARESSTSFADFRNRVIAIDEEYNENHLRTEYNTANAMAQMAKQIVYLKRFDMIEISTVGDDKVRLSHQKLDGVVLPYNDIVALGLVPPLDWNCRCALIPAQGKPESKRIEAESFAAQMPDYFKTNYAMQEKVFGESHPHLIDTPEELRASDYDLPAPEIIMQDPDLPEITLLADQGQATAIWESMQGEINQPDGVNWGVFGNLQAMLTDGRFKYVAIFRELLSKADEIWSVRRADRVQKRVIKYYKQGPVVFSYAVDNVQDWKIDEMALNASGTYEVLNDDIRRGSLIYQK